MSILYLDLVGGIAGDMFVAAMVELGVPLEHLQRHLAALDVPGIAIGTRREARHHIAGTRFLVSDTSAAAGPLPGPGAAGHEHGHGHVHGPGAAAGHPHRDYREVRRLLAAAPLPEGARALAQRIFARLAEAEGRVHGIAADDVTFHEVGAWDSIADVVCAALALEHLRPGAVYASPVPLGAGTVRTAHGTIPVPGPATLELLRGFPVTTGGPAFERTTPTGAAILATVARPAPEPFRFVPERVGVGLGSHDPPEVANLLRAVWGRAVDPAPGEGAPDGPSREEIECAEVNLDDTPPEWIGHLMERLLDAGALDVALIPVHMKKNRPGTLLQALYAPELRERVEALLFGETTTLGVRYHRLERAVLPREPVTVETPWGPVAGKVARYAGRSRFAPEYEACRAVADRAGVPLREVYAAAERAWAGRDGGRS